MQNRSELMPGVFLTHLSAQKFKTGLLSAHLVTPLRKETASLNALLPAVLRRGTAKYPDMESLSAALDTLYGAQIDYTVRKKGERQCVGFVSSFIDDRYAPGGEQLLEPVAELLGELFLTPALENGVFVPAYVEGEKQNLIDGIRAIRNDKQDWADVRLMQEMCAKEHYGVLRLGDETSTAAITPAALYDHYGKVLAQSRLELYYCGSADRQRVENALRAAFANLPRGEMKDLPPMEKCAAPAAPRYFTEEMDITQGKLSMGWRCATDDVPAMILANLLFGGTSNAKLFMNVREKLSLCYYASSSFARSKGILTVACGIEPKNYDTAVAEIMAQLQAVANGEWEDWELDGAMATMCSSLTSLQDAQGAQENYYLGQNATDTDETPEDLLAALQAVTPQRIRDAAASCTLDTVFFLKGKEAAV